MLNFEWDSKKAISNLKKHGVSFEEATTVFSDLLSWTISDPLHSDQENRFVTIGSSHVNRILVVVHADRGDTIRIISARIASPRERRKYAENES
jgi:uncharacterized DUF497 family protein